MNAAWLVALLVAVGGGTGLPVTQRVAVRQGLLFYASFERSADADSARGRARVVRSEGVTKAKGKHGSALRFARKGGTRFCEYSAARNVRPDRGTIAFHFKPDWSGDQATHRYFFFRPGTGSRGAGANSPDSMGLHTMARKKPPQQIWLWYDDHGGGNNIVRAPIGDWRKGEWHHVAATWDTERLRIYVDGVLKGERGLRGQITDPATTFFVGSSRNGVFSSEGVLDEFCVYDRALSAGEIGVLTGRPELVAPRIHALALRQTLYYRRESDVVFRCELGGQFDAERHRLTAAVARAADGAVVGSAVLSAKSGRGSVRLTKPAEGAYALRVRLETNAGKRLDEKTAPLRVLQGPFDR